MADPCPRPFSLKFTGAGLRRGSGVASLVAAVSVFGIGTALADSHENVTVSHGFTNFGELMHPADITHLPYVNPDAPKGGEISLSAVGNFDSFNPYTRKGVTAAGTQLMWENMVIGTADDPYGVYCYLCETMEYPDSLDWVIFNLRDDVRFWDGTSMTADDVKFTFETFLEQGIAEFRNAFAGFIESVEVLGPDQIKFSFTDEAPRRDVIGFAGGIPVFSKAWFEETGARIDDSTLEPFMGTGAYKVDSVDVGRQLVFARDPDHWGKEHPYSVGQNNFDKIRYEYFADNTAALEGFKSGAYLFKIENSSKDWATGYDFPAVASGDVIVESIPDGNIGSAQSFIFNLRRDKWQDPRVREALRLMFNFEWANETLFFGLYTRVNSFWENSPLEARGLPTSEEIAILQPLVDQGLLDPSILTTEPVMAPTSGMRALDRGNLRAASALLDEAGWITNDRGVREKDGEELEAVFLSFSPAFDRIINPYVEALSRLGVAAKLERVDIAQYQQRRRDADYDLTTHTFSMTLEPGNVLRQWYGSETADDSSRNLMGLKNEAIDALLDPVIEAETLEEMTPAVHALDRALRAEGFWVPQWYKDVYTLAYYDMYRYPDPATSPLALGHLSWWWVDPDAEAALRAKGAIR